MDSTQLYRSHQASWQALADLLNRAEKNIRSLSPAEIEQLGQLYRIASSDLALARRDFPQHQVTFYLNQLVAQGHAVIYRSQPLVGRRIRNFFVEDFPRVYRKMLPFTVTATLIFLISAILALAAVLVQPDTTRWLLPDGGQGIRPVLESGKLWTDIPAAERPYTSSFIMTNNIQVAILAFSGGLLAGVYTVWVIINNGLMLGAVLGLTLHYGLGFDLMTFIVGHGVIELSVIMMAGGAGLMLGWAIIHPGLLRRGDALRSAANRAVYLVIGCLPLLLVAGAIEGFISPADNIPGVVKWLVGILSGAGLYSYLFLAGRPAKAGREYRIAPPKAESGPSISNSD
jgi:uncharacterized membrane protein SpoIIM required for sporulation